MKLRPPPMDFTPASVSAVTPCERGQAHPAKNARKMAVAHDFMIL